jgi:hypothetical protein
MGERIQYELDKIKMLAIAKNESFFAPGRKFVEVRYSLSKAIKTKEEADRFLAELEWVIKQAQAK